MFSVLLNFLSMLNYVISHEMTVYGEMDRVEKEVATAYFNTTHRTIVMYPFDICVFIYSWFYSSATKSTNVLFVGTAEAAMYA
jgi:hypothetical protein